MSDIPARTHAVVDLNPGCYQGSLTAYGMLLDTDAHTPLLRVGLRTPASELIELQVRREDAYVIGFKGADGWYGFDGETGVWGPPCGTGVNYHDLGTVGKVAYDDLKRLGDIARFRSGTKLEKRFIAIAIALTSEAARHAIVATYFVGLTNSVGTPHAQYLQGAVDFEHLRRTHFTQYSKRSRSGDAGILLKKRR